MSGRLATAVGRGAALLPAPAVERARLAEARRLELRVRRSGAVRGAALVLHAVAQTPGDPDFEIEPPLAAGHLDAIVGHLIRRYRIVRASELIAAARARHAGERVPVALTFDDDLPSHLALAAPILRRHGVVATAFLCGAQTPFWWQLLQAAVDARAIEATALAPLPPAVVEPALERRPRAIVRLAKAVEDLAPEQRDAVAARLGRAAGEVPGPLSAHDRAQLAVQGWEIGFHTRRHDVMTAMDDGALLDALQRGRDEIAPAPIRTFAYPHGKAGKREAAAVQRAGYTAAYTGRAEVLTELTNCHLIGRLQPDTATLGRFALQLARALCAP